MRLVTFERAGRRSFGALDDEAIIDLGAHLPDVPDLEALLALDRLEEAEAIAAANAPDHRLAAVTLDKPLTRFGKCFCVGINYPDRNAEYQDGSAPPRWPSLFVRFPESFVAHGASLLRPPESEQLDYEGELAVVIGRRARRVQEERAMAHVAGFTQANDGSLRDWVRHGKFNVTPGKNFAGSGALGPALVTLDEAGEGPFRLTTRVNGELRQEDTTDRMIFPIPMVIAYISRFCTLEPGDVILTGTPTGSGGRFDPPRWLVQGDVVEVEAAGIGALRNPVRDESA